MVRIGEGSEVVVQDADAYRRMIEFLDEIDLAASGRLCARDETGADSLTEVIRRALAVYEVIWQKTSAGETLILVDHEGDETPIHLLWA